MGFACRRNEGLIFSFSFLFILDPVLGRTDTSDWDPKDDILFRTEAKDPWHCMFLWRDSVGVSQMALYRCHCRTLWVYQPVWRFFPGGDRLLEETARHWQCVECSRNLQGTKNNMARERRIKNQPDEKTGS